MVNLDLIQRYEKPYESLVFQMKGLLGKMALGGYEPV